MIWKECEVKEASLGFFCVKTTIAKLFIILPYINYTNSSKFVKF